MLKCSSKCNIIWRGRREKPASSFENDYYFKEIWVILSLNYLLYLHAYLYICIILYHLRSNRPFLFIFIFAISQTSNFVFFFSPPPIIKKKKKGKNVSGFVLEDKNEPIQNLGSKKKMDSFSGFKRFGGNEEGIVCSFSCVKISFQIENSFFFIFLVLVIYFLL